MSQESRARVLRSLDTAPADWEYEEADTVGACDSCAEHRPLRRAPESLLAECRPCWDRDTLGPAEEAS